MLGKPRSALENNTQTFSLGLSQSLQNLSLYSSGQLSDFRDKTDSSHDLSTLTGSFSLTSSLTQALSVTSGITLTRTKDLDDKSIDKSQSYSVSVNWGVIPQRLTISTWGTLVVAKSNDVLMPVDNVTTDASLEFSYSFRTGLTLNLGYELNAYRDAEDSSNNYEGHGFVTRLSYSF
jgi:predicted porin